MRFSTSSSVLRSGLSLLMLVLVMTTFPTPAAPAKKLRHPRAYPKLRLPGVTRGEAAVATLGLRLAEVAAAYDLEPRQLIALLHSDVSLAVDRRGRLHFTEEPAPAPALADSVGVSGTEVQPPWVEVPPTANAFALHSSPGSRRTIFLDFHGAVLTNTAWNVEFRGGAPIVAPPYDLDGNPASFSEIERANIVKIWLRMAEDFAPFDVDVTTELTDEAQLTRTSEDDLNFGVRVLFSPLSPILGNYGGMAYVGVFDEIGDYHKPAIVMPERLSQSEKNIADAASHEVGHTLGLNHDGTTTGLSYYQGGGSGETGWAPLMGIGYYKNLTQWSKGEYRYANNFEDDLAIMQSLGLEAQTDDHGDTRETATFLPAGSTFAVTGVIGLAADVDVFSFDAAAGPVSLAVTSASIGGNLDVLLQLFQSNGALVATNNSTTNLAAALDLNLPAGRYYVSVQGTGKGTPLASTGYSSYGSMGRYILRGNLVDPTGSVPPVALAEATPSEGPAPLVVSLNGANSFDQDGAVVSYAWDFGDGIRTVGAIVSHTYSFAGQYQATLTVTDNSGFSRSDTVAITVTPPNTPPIAAATASPASGWAPLLVNFSGAGSSDPGGGLVDYRWDFGDGTTGGGASISHLYTTPGVYDAWLVVTDTGGLTASNSVRVEARATVRPPTASFTATPATGPAPLLTTFDATNSGVGDYPLAGFAWSFGDGSTGSGPVVTHSFATSDQYAVVLVVTDTFGLSATNSLLVLVSAPLTPVATGNLAPNPVVNATPRTGFAPLRVFFTSAGTYDSDGTIASLAWNFGDGTTSPSASPDHVYQLPGNYTASLTATDNQGATRSVQVEIQVSAEVRLRSQAITLFAGGSTTSKAVRATVRVTDPAGNPIAGATVKGAWSGLVGGTSSATSDANGDASMTSSRTSTNGTMTFQITNLIAPGRVYAPDQNVVSSASITVSGLPNP